MALPYVIAVGNLTADPELRFLSNGTALLKLRIACGERRKTAEGKWEDGDTTYLNVSAWRQIAENAAESLTKGTKVMVTGRLKSRTVEHPEHGKQTYYELDADSIGPDLTNATVKVSRTVRSTNTWGTTETSTATNLSTGWDTVPAQNDGQVPF
mgnify:CR=1 FL=1